MPQRFAQCHQLRFFERFEFIAHHEDTKNTTVKKSVKNLLILSFVSFVNFVVKYESPPGPVSFTIVYNPAPFGPGQRHLDFFQRGGS